MMNVQERSDDWLAAWPFAIVCLLVFPRCGSTLSLCCNCHVSVSPCRGASGSPYRRGSSVPHGLPGALLGLGVVGARREGLGGVTRPLGEPPTLVI